jgi:hypothetical protein
MAPPIKTATTPVMELVLKLAPAATGSVPDGEGAPPVVCAGLVPIGAALETPVAFVGTATGPV